MPLKAKPQAFGSAQVDRKLRKRGFLSWLIHWDNSIPVRLHRAGPWI